MTLAGSLTDETVDDLLRAAENNTKFELERLLAERKLGSDVRGQVALAANPEAELSLGIGGSPISAGELQRAPNGDPELSPGIVEPVLMSLEQLSRGAETSTKIARPYPYRLMMSQEMRDDLEHARNLLGHQVPSGDVAAVLHRGLKALIREVEKRKFSATDRPRPSKAAATPGSRHVPAEVQRAVWARDDGRCTFVGENGKRCPARRMLEFDHVLEVARGGLSTASNMRLLCKAHNQYRAEQTYGHKFMEDRREESQAARGQAAAKRDAEQVIGCMRRLGFTADESRRAAAHACAVSNTSIESRVRAALAYLVPPRSQRGCPSTSVVDLRLENQGEMPHASL